MAGNKTYKVYGGLYLVVDPSHGEEEVLSNLGSALKGGVDLVQIWNNWKPGQDRKAFIDKVCDLVHAFYVPVLINEDWEWVVETDVDGVHFDQPTMSFQSLRNFVPDAIIGLTCCNDLTLLNWAEENAFDYVSFCSVYPSPSVDVCDIVTDQTMSRASSITGMPLFGSGGVNEKNARELMGKGLDGLAVISSVMNAACPESAASSLKKIIEEYETKNA